jgi:hypothetical protein
MLLFNIRHFIIIVESGTLIVIFQVFTAANMKMTAFRDISSGSLVAIEKHFRDACYLHHQYDHPGKIHASISNHMIKIYHRNQS